MLDVLNLKLPKKLNLYTLFYLFKIILDLHISNLCQYLKIFLKYKFLNSNEFAIYLLPFELTVYPAWKAHILCKKFSTFWKKYQIHSKNLGNNEKISFFTLIAILIAFRHSKRKMNIFIEKMRYFLCKNTIFGNYLP